MARMDVGRATTALYLVPVVAIGIAFGWLGQIPGVVELVGGAVALAGVVFANTGSRRTGSAEVSANRSPIALGQISPQGLHSRPR